MSTQVTISNKRKADSVAAAKRAKARYSARKSRIGKAVSTKFHRFIRACSTLPGYKFGMDLQNGFTYNGANTGSYGLQFAFTLSGLQVYSAGALVVTIPMPNYTELTALYDQYRIDYVDMQFIFSNNQSSVNTPATVLPIMYLCKDYDDTNSASVTDLQQYSTQQTWQLGNMTNGNGVHHVKVKPNVDISLYQGLTTGYARGKPMLVDTGSPAVPHYGVKVAFDPISQPGASTLVGYLSINAVFHLTMAHSK